MSENVLLIFTMILPLTMESKPGTFFWKPRLALDLARSPAVRLKHSGLRPPTPENIKSGYVVLLDGYNVGITAIALAQIMDVDPMFDHLNPTRASYYTNMYRWALRHLSLYPDWFAGKGKGYPVTHKVWFRRYFYNDRLVPTWLQKLFPWVNEDDWKKEAKDMKRFLRYAEPIFGKLQKYPNKNFNNYKSQIVKDTIENLDRSSNSIPKP